MFAEEPIQVETPAPASDGCPECGSTDIRVALYDNGREADTGYRDCGERGICRECGYQGELSEFL